MALIDNATMNNLVKIELGLIDNQSSAAKAIRRALGPLQAWSKSEFKKNPKAIQLIEETLDDLQSHIFGCEAGLKPALLEYIDICEAVLEELE